MYDLWHKGQLANPNFPSLRKQLDQFGLELYFYILSTFTEPFSINYVYRHMITRKLLFVGVFWTSQLKKNTKKSTATKLCQHWFAIHCRNEWFGIFVNGWRNIIKFRFVILFDFDEQSVEYFSWKILKTLIVLILVKFVREVEQHQETNKTKNCFFNVFVLVGY